MTYIYLLGITLYKSAFTLFVKKAAVMQNISTLTQYQPMLMKANEKRPSHLSVPASRGQMLSFWFQPMINQINSWLRNSYSLLLQGQ